MSYNLLDLHYGFVYQAYILIYCCIIICIMINHWCSLLLLTLWNYNICFHLLTLSPPSFYVFIYFEIHYYLFKYVRHLQTNIYPYSTNKHLSIHYKQTSIYQYTTNIYPYTRIQTSIHTLQRNKDQSIHYTTNIYP